MYPLRSVLLVAGLLLCAVTGAAATEPAAGKTGVPRLVSLAPHITELVYAAGAGAQLVGVVDYSDFPAAAQALPRIGDSFRIDYETLRRLQPDIVLAWGSGNPAEIVQRLRELGYRVITLEPQALEDVADHIELIGELAQTTAIAAPAATVFRTELADLRLRYRDSASRRVFFQISADPYFSVTGQHFISQVIELCGGANIFANLPGLAPAITLESIVSANPDVIIAASDGDDGWQAGWRRWRSITAVQTNALYGVDPDLLSRSGPRILAGAREVCNALEQARLIKQPQ